MHPIHIVTSTESSTNVFKKNVFDSCLLQQKVRRRTVGREAVPGPQPRCPPPSPPQPNPRPRPRAATGRCHPSTRERQTRKPPQPFRTAVVDRLLKTKFQTLDIFFFFKLKNASKVKIQISLFSIQ